MANYPVSFATHKTLATNTIDTVTLTSNRSDVVEVLNRGTTDPIYFTKDGSTPVIGADDNYIVLAGQGVSVAARANTDTIKLIAASAVAYSVIGDENLDD